MNIDVVAEYMTRVQAVYATGETTEHSFRPALEFLFKNIEDSVEVINEPRLVTNVGRPDFAFKRKIGHNFITIGHCEAKDIDKDINPRAMKDGNKNQYERYLKGLPNLIYTNGLDFRFYVKGEFIRDVSIADFAVGITPLKRRYAELAQALKEFAAERLQTITSAKRLAELMAGKAILIKTVLSNSLIADADLDSDLAGQFKAFKKHLIHDLTPEGFADIYAETVVYGMFAARLKDKTKEDFSRQEALELLPKSNPFLRSLFTYVAGADLDERIKRDFDELAEIFLHVDPDILFKDFGHFTQRNDPFIHFYEDFLSIYNPKKRKERGVWYTPKPVVNFIVRAVDDVLKSEFGLPMGLADTSKVTVDVDTGQTKTVRGKAKPIIEKRELHRVQILDPATGTGTFLAETIKQIAGKVKDVAPGQWSSYVEQDLIPRVHGFELLMASYAMCHMKLDMMLKDMDYEPTKNPPRLSVYLTNSLEEGDKEVRDLFMAKWLSNEAKAANEVKHDKPIMCIIGNPPYNIFSGNMSEEQINLVNDYRYVDGQKIKEKGMLQFEININNDYIKFIALAEKYIAKNKSGILSFITSHGFLKSASFRGMRNQLLRTFDDIKILDLHGNSEIKEVTPFNIIDKNVFNIKQGVCIIVAIKKDTGTSQSLGRIFYDEFWGGCEEKNEKLYNSSVDTLDWKECFSNSPNYTFHPSDTAYRAYSLKFVSLKEFMPVYSSGVITARDKFSISESSELLIKNANDFSGNEDLSDSALCETLGISEKKGWDIARARQRLRLVKDKSGLIKDIAYRPFDNRKILFHDSVVWTTARSTMDHMLQGENYALISARSEKSGTCSHFFTSKNLVETKCGERTTQSAVFPLYLYPDEDALDQTRRVNFDPKIHKAIVQAATSDKFGDPDEVAIFDYIYGVLHCPAYRETYAEFLKIDFPRIPYPPSPEVFWDVSAKGTALRRLHLMEAEAIGEANYPFLGTGESVVEKPAFKETSDGVGVVHINKQQYFDNVPRLAWEFYIGGYQPAQKWLKDRKGRTLDFNDILHYQKIIKILSETDRIMKTIEMPLA